MFFAMHTPGLTDLVTIENYPPRIKKAKEVFQKADAPIRLIEGDAAEVLPTLPNSRFDFVLMDGAKGQYPILLPESGVWQKVRCCFPTMFCRMEMSWSPVLQ